MFILRINLYDFIATDIYVIMWNVDNNYGKHDLNLYALYVVYVLMDHYALYVVCVSTIDHLSASFNRSV